MIPLTVDIQYVGYDNHPKTGKVAVDFPTVYWSTGVGAPTVLPLVDILAVPGPGDSLVDGGIIELNSGKYRLTLPNTVRNEFGRRLEIWGEGVDGFVLFLPIELRLENGSGAYTVVIPFTDSDDNPLQNVLVSLTLNGLTYTSLTDTDGESEFRLDAGTYAMAATYPGFTSASGSVVITANATEDVVVMASHSFSAPPSGDEVTGFVYTRVAGVVTGGKTLYYRLDMVPDGYGSKFDVGEIHSVISDDDGVAEFPVVKGADYSLSYDQFLWIRLSIPTGATTPYAIPNT